MMVIRERGNQIKKRMSLMYQIIRFIIILLTSSLREVKEKLLCSFAL